MLVNKGIGGNEVPLDANESISEIPQNRTLFTQKLTADDHWQWKTLQSRAGEKE